MTATATKLAGSMHAKPRSTTKNLDDPRGQFGAFLRAWVDRHHGGDSAPLAKALGVTPRAIQKWMEGSHGPKFADLDRVAKAMGRRDWGELAAAACRFAAK